MLDLKYFAAIGFLILIFGAPRLAQAQESAPAGPETSGRLKEVKVIVNGVGLGSTYSDVLHRFGTPTSNVKHGSILVAERNGR